MERIFFCCSEMRTREVMMKRAWRERGFLLLRSGDENERNSEWMNGAGMDELMQGYQNTLLSPLFLKNETIAAAA